MRAVILATGDCHRHAEPDFHAPELMELAGTPMIQRVVELLTEAGIREFDFVLCNEPHQIRSFLGSGIRWGSQFRFHLCRDSSKPYRSLRALSFEERETVVIANGRCLPSCEAEDLRTAFQDDAPAAVCWRVGGNSASGGKLSWSGWAAVKGAWLSNMDAEATQDEFAGHILAEARAAGSVLEIATPTYINSASDLIAAHWRAGLNHSGNQAGEQASTSSNGITIARNASVHPTAVLNAPVFIGEYSRIGRRAKIGPFASIGHNCIVADDTVVTNSVIHSGTWVGPGLHLTYIVTDGSRLTNTTMGATTTNPGGLMIARVPVSIGPLLPHQLVSCLGAVLLGLVAVPLVAFLLAVGAVARLTVVPGRKRPTWRQALRGTPYLGHFFNEILPALPALILGRRNLIGVSAWAAPELTQVPLPWRQLYQNSPVGLITEGFVCFGPNPPIEERAAADAYYVVKRKASYNTKLAFRYAHRVASDIAALPRVLARSHTRAVVSL